MQGCDPQSLLIPARDQASTVGQHWPPKFVFSRHRDLLSTLLDMADWRTPFSMPHDHCLSIGRAPSQGLVYTNDEGIVIKVPFQYPIMTRPDSEAGFRRDDSLCNCEVLRKEAEIFQILALRPHRNIVRCLRTRPTMCVFLERVMNPLQLA